MEDDRSQGPGIQDPEDGVPVLTEVVRAGESDGIPVLHPQDAVHPPLEPEPESAPEPEPQPQPLLYEDLAALSETLRLALGRELDYAVEGLVYERLQAAMEELSTRLKERVHHQLEAVLPQLVEAVLRGTRDEPRH